MPTWDQPSARWDSALHWDESTPLPNPNPKTKTKRMKRQDYFPTRIGDQVVWLRNYKTKLPLHSAALGLVPAEVTANLLDVSNGIYLLDDYRGALETASTSCYQCIDDALYAPSVPGTTAAMGFTPPVGAPTPVANGCLKRLFAYIADKIKPAAAYSMMIGEDLGTEGPAEPAPDPTVAPVFQLRATTGGKVEVLWTKGQFDGVKIEADLGTAGSRTDVDLRPNYTLNWLPPTGQSAVIKVRLRFIYKGEDYGNWSAWQQWTLTGV